MLVVGFGRARLPRKAAGSGRVGDVLAVLSPGQGSQKPGFLTPWLDLPGAEARLTEWSALAGVDLLHPADAITLAGVRGREMAAACALEPTGMSAVLGGDPDEVVATIEKHGLFPANRNGAGQIVAAGALPALAEFAAAPPAKARVIALAVAGAFHTPFMAPAETALAAAAGGVTVHDPARTLLSNLDGTAVATGAEMLRRLIRQVTAPVRWDLCIRA